MGGGVLCTARLSDPGSNVWVEFKVFIEYWSSQHVHRTVGVRYIINTLQYISVRVHHIYGIYVSDRSPRRLLTGALGAEWPHVTPPPWPSFCRRWYPNVPATTRTTLHHHPHHSAPLSTTSCGGQHHRREVYGGSPPATRTVYGNTGDLK